MKKVKRKEEKKRKIDEEKIVLHHSFPMQNRHRSKKRLMDMQSSGRSDGWMNRQTKSLLRCGDAFKLNRTFDHKKSGELFVNSVISCRMKSSNSFEIQLNPTPTDFKGQINSIS